jgi:hypothetical protein
MPFLNVIPEGLLGASAQVAALTARLVGANAVHAAATATILPPGSDPVSVKTAAGLIGHGGEHEAAAAMGNEELARSSVNVGESGVNYLLADALGTGAYAAAGGV